MSDLIEKMVESIVDASMMNCVDERCMCVGRRERFDCVSLASADDLAKAAASILLREMMAFAIERDGWDQNTCACAVKAFAESHSINLEGE